MSFRRQASSSFVPFIRFTVLKEVICCFSIGWVTGREKLRRFEGPWEKTIATTFSWENE